MSFAETVDGGAGFGAHPHQDMEIITYVLEGAIAHRDTMNNVSQLHAGEVQVMSAGTGVFHSEFNASKTDRLNFLQIWIKPNGTQLSVGDGAYISGEKALEFEPGVEVDALLFELRGN